MTFDQEHHARVGLDRTVETVRDRLQLRRLVRWDGPRSGLEVDRVEVDARHLHANIRAVADLVERVATVDPLHRRRHHRLVDHVRRGLLGVDDIAIVGHVDDGRRRVDIETADRLRIAVAVVDDDELAPGRVPADSPQQPTVLTYNGNDLAAVGTDHHGAGIGADSFGADVAGAIAEAIEIVAADVGLPTRIADDDAVRLGVDGAAAFDRLAALVAVVGDGGADHGTGDDTCTDRERRQVTLRRTRRWRQGRGRRGRGAERRRNRGRRVLRPVGRRGRSRRARHGARCSGAGGGSRRPGRGACLRLGRRSSGSGCTSRRRTTLASRGRCHGATGGRRRCRSRSCTRRRRRTWTAGRRRRSATGSRRGRRRGRGAWSR
ncbi:hypothetical protein ACVWZL_007657 [Bradyrhizobium sp. GM2.4]